MPFEKLVTSPFAKKCTLTSIHDPTWLHQENVFPIVICEIDLLNGRSHVLSLHNNAIFLLSSLSLSDRHTLEKFPASNREYYSWAHYSLPLIRREKGTLSKKRVMMIISVIGGIPWRVVSSFTEAHCWETLGRTSGPFVIPCLYSRSMHN